MADKRSNEAFYLDAKGVKQDADIHAELLTPEANAASQAISRAHLLNLGYTVEQVDMLYGKQK